MVDAELEVAAWAQRRDRDVCLVGKAQEMGVVPDEAKLVVGPPGRLVEVLGRVRIEPAPPEPVVRDVVGASELGQHREQGRLGDLVVVDREDPRAAALAVEPGERPVDRLRIRVADQDVRMPGQRRLDAGVCPLVEGDDDLVTDRPKQREQRRDAWRRTGCHAAEREGARARFLRRGQGGNCRRNEAARRRALSPGEQRPPPVLSR